MLAFKGDDLFILSGIFAWVIAEGGRRIFEDDCHIWTYILFQVKKDRKRGIDTVEI
jgi:hypothetical protein